MDIRAAARAAVHQFCYYGGINRAARSRKRRHLLVLAYHGVVSKPQTDRARYANTVSVDEFDRHLAMLRRYFHPIGAADLAEWHAGKDSLPDHPVLVTFDDGYRNNLTLAAPVLCAHGIPCLFHLATGYIGTPRTLWTTDLANRLRHWPGDRVPTPEGDTVAMPEGGAGRAQIANRIKERCKRISWESLQSYLDRVRSVPFEAGEDPELCGFLTWDEVRELRRQGFDIGAHTVEHPILTQVTAERLRFELRESKRRIEAETGAPCDVIAYPNGDEKSISAEVARAAEAEGYRLGFTTIERFTARPGDALAVNRLCVMGHLPLDDFHFRVSGLRMASDYGTGPFAG